MPWVLGIRWGLRCLGHPTEEQRAMGVNPALGEGADPRVGLTLTCRPFCPGSPGSPMLPLAP